MTARPRLPSINLPPHLGDRLLVHRRGVPGLDRGVIRLARLIARAGLPAVAFEESRRRSERIRGHVEIAGAVRQNVLRQKLRLADFAVHGAARAGREHAAIDQLQRRIELVGEVFGAPAFVGERGNGGEHVLVYMLANVTLIYPPYSTARSGWYDL